MTIETATKDLEKVKFTVVLRDGISRIIETYVYDICHPFEHQAIEETKSDFVHLRKQDLADRNPNNQPLHINILKGSKHCWDFFQTNNQVCGVSGPVALGSGLGCILSSTIRKNSESTNQTSHGLFVVTIPSIK